MTEAIKKQRTMQYFSTWELPKYCRVCGNPIIIVEEQDGFDVMTGKPHFDKIITCSTSGAVHFNSLLIEVGTFGEPELVSNSNKWWNSFCEWFYRLIGRKHG